MSLSVTGGYPVCNCSTYKATPLYKINRPQTPLCIMKERNQLKIFHNQLVFGLEHRTSKILQKKTFSKYTSF